MATEQRSSSRKRPGLGQGVSRITPITFGVTLGLLAVAVEAFFTVNPPSAYGVCIACHGRDLVNWLVNQTTGMSLTVAEVSLAFPVLTVVGVLIGSTLAALQHREFHWSWPDNPLRSFLWGFVVMSSALLAAGCSIRLILQITRGDSASLLAFIGMTAGIVMTTVIMKRRALR